MLNYPLGRINYPGSRPQSQSDCLACPAWYLNQRCQNGLFEQVQLLILYAILPLILYIVSYYFFDCVLTYCCDKVSVARELFSPKPLLYFWALQEYLPSCNVFDLPDDFRRRMVWRALNQKVHTILVRTDLQEFNVIKSVLYLQADIP